MTAMSVGCVHHVWGPHASLASWCQNDENQLNTFFCVAQVFFEFCPFSALHPGSLCSNGQQAEQHIVGKVASGDDPQSNGDDDDAGSTIVDEPLLHLIKLSSGVFDVELFDECFWFHWLCWSKFRWVPRNPRIHVCDYIAQVTSLDSASCKRVGSLENNKCKHTIDTFRIPLEFQIFYHHQDIFCFDCFAGAKSVSTVYSPALKTG